MREKSVREQLEETEFENLLQCLFGLNELDVRCYEKITKKDKTWTDELAEELGKDESTIHRSITKLIDVGLVDMEKIPYENGGYKHEYTMRDPEEAAQDMRLDICEWVKASYKMVDKFEEEYGSVHKDEDMITEADSD